MTERWDVAVVGGGAAGFFGAIQCAEAAPGARVVILEAARRVLTKVRISGGGRCNVTHHCLDPDEMARRHYPRGHYELIGPMYRFGVRQTMEWFEGRGVGLKTEEDGRIFPITDDSQTVVDCLRRAARKAGVKVRTATPVHRLTPPANDGDPFELLVGDDQFVPAHQVLVATGGIRLPRSRSMVDQLDHSLVEARPSLFTFDVEDGRIDGLAGISVEPVEIEAAQAGLDSRGPLLITHRGVSGPAVLEMSAWGARRLYDLDYRFELQVDWLPDVADIEGRLIAKRQEAGRRQVRTLSPFKHLPNRLWARLVAAAGVGDQCQWSSLTKTHRHRLVDQLRRSVFSVHGKSTHKEEFVTAGGVPADEVDMRTMESRFHPGLHFAGEVMDIDGITGGFNFQAAWTTGFLAGQSMAEGMAQ